MKSVILLCVFGFSIASFAQNIKPYLQAPTPNSIYVNWISQNSGSSTISIGTSPTNLNLTVTGNQSLFNDGTISYYYNTGLLNGLNANTKYYYCVHSNGLSSDTLSFKTKPLPGQAASADGHLRFLIMGDNQIQTTGRYDTLVHRAKEKIFEKYGGDPSDFIELTFMVGDQVDLGNLTQYKNIHFAYNQELSGYIPIQTTVGNHETYGSMGMNAYYAHFYLDQLAYQGISSGTENYYSMQVGNVLFISLSSEHTGTAQYNWLQSVLNAADNDNTVDWILTFSHRPYESEQYVGDISSWIKNNAVPMCMQHEKYFMHVGAHHHIYSRGQFKEEPVYNIISGGTAWDQYWGQSTEQDFEYIQKTISNWCYQIMDFDVTNGKVDIETYSIGSPMLFANSEWKDNQLVDEFHRYKNQASPNTPSITTNFGDSLQLPVAVQSTPFSTSTTELMNSTEFQVSQTSNFSVLELDKLRDYENLFGQAPGQAADSTQDLNAGVNILNYTIPVGSLGNGKHYIRVRHRDRNLNWSNWSLTDSMIVYNSFVSLPSVTMDSTAYPLGSSMQALYANGPGNATDWIGLYHTGQTPGTVASTSWQYCSGGNGTMNFASNALTSSDIYYAAYFELDGYNEIAPRDYFYYGLIPTITSDTNSYPVGQSIILSIDNAPHIADSIEVIKVGFTHGVQPAAFAAQVNQTSETFTVNPIPKGYYSVKYYFKGIEVIGEPYFFSVGDTITNLWIDKPIYDLGESIIATWTDAPGIAKDWLGIYHAQDNPNVDPLVSYSYFNGQASGTKTLTDSLLPSSIGNYFIVMFTNDSYTEVSNRNYFSIIDQSAGVETNVDHGVSIYPNPLNKENLTLFSSEYPIEYIQLIDNTGKVVYRTDNVANQKYSMVSEQLPAGTYIVEIQTRKLFRYKLVVN